MSMVFESSELSLGKVLLFIVLVGAFVGLTFLLLGSGALTWIVLLLVVMPIVAVVLGLRSIRQG
jgi:hypothetical protein